MTVIALVSRMSESDRDRVRAVCTDVDFLDSSEDRDELAARGGDVEIVFGNVRPFELPRLPKLKWVHAGWTGVENLLYPEMIERGVTITNTRGQGATAMAEHAIAGLFYMSRDLGTFCQTNPQGKWRPKTSRTVLAGSRALILGVGAVGKVLAAKLAALGLNVRGVNFSGRPVDGVDEMFALENIREHLSDIDHLIILLPDTPHTHKVVDVEFLRALKKGADVVNISRGGLLDESALLKLLDEGHLSSAVLDVTDPEPPVAGSPLFTHDKVLLTGHSSSGGGPRNSLSMEIFLHNLECWMKDEPDGMRFRVDMNMKY